MPKGDRLSAKLGRGEFEHPARANVVARYGFLDTIYRLAPEAVTVLEQDQDATRWAARFGLHELSWFVDVAARTLDMWQRDPGMRRHPMWATIGIGGRLVHELPAVQSWQYEDESEASFDARIAQHKREVRAVAAERGLIRTRELRNPQYIEWLVRRVVQGWSIETIIETYQTEKGLDASTVQRGINDAADLVGIPPPSTLKPQ